MKIPMLILYIITFNLILVIIYIPSLCVFVADPQYPSWPWTSQNYWDGRVHQLTVTDAHFFQNLTCFEPFRLRGTLLTELSEVEYCRTFDFTMLVAFLVGVIVVVLIALFIVATCLQKVCKLLHFLILFHKFLCERTYVKWKTPVCLKTNETLMCKIFFNP